MIFLRVLYYIIIKRGDKKHSSSEIIDYCSNSSICRRYIILFVDFPEYTKETNPTGCACCDVCAMNCTCGYCIEKLSIFTV